MFGGFNLSLFIVGTEHRSVLLTCHAELDPSSNKAALMDSCFRRNDSDNNLSCRTRSGIHNLLTCKASPYPCAP